MTNPLTAVRDKLERLARLGNGEFLGNSEGNLIAQSALLDLDLLGEPTEAMCDMARGFIMGLDLNIRTWKPMADHLKMGGYWTTTYINKKAKSDPTGHITKWDVAYCIWQLMEPCEGNTAAPGDPAPTAVKTEFPDDGSIYFMAKDGLQKMHGDGTITPVARPTPEPLACREAFEARGRKLKWNLFTFPNGEYETLWMQKAWEAWRDCWNQRIATVSRKEGV